MPLLLETICLKNGTPLHLAYHEARMEKSAPKKLKKWDLSNFIMEAYQAQEIEGDWIKCRILYDQNVQKISFQPYTPQPPKTLQLIEAPELAYPLKYADRTELECLACQKGIAQDILIVKKGYLTDTSYCNVALFDGTFWYTPQVPLLEGTTRARLIEAGKLRLAQIHVSDLQNFQVLRLFNAMLDFESGYEVAMEAIYPIKDLY